MRVATSPSSLFRINERSALELILTDPSRSLAHHTLICIQGKTSSRLLGLLACARTSAEDLWALKSAAADARASALPST